MAELPDQQLTARLRDASRLGLLQLKDAFLAGDLKAADFLSARSGQVDAILVQLWVAQEFPATVTLAAVGGYGRGELYPGSDVDLLILLPDQTDPSVLSKIEQLVGQFWDIGLEVGHSVRTLDECVSEATADVTIQTALLETRLLVGDSVLFEQFRMRLLNALDPHVFYRAKLAEQQARYLRFNETPYSLEPNCKDSPGGLRDLQIIVWLAKSCGCGGNWEELHRHDIVTAEETRNLDDCEAFLQDLRVRLHLHTGRREDRLVFDVQNAVATQLGYEAKDDRRASERMMQTYYKNAKSITQLNTLVLQNIGSRLFSSRVEEAPVLLDDAFQIRAGILDIRRPDVFSEAPHRLLDCFRHLQEHDLREMSARTIRALWQGRNLIDDAFRADPGNRRRFMALLQSENGLIQEFRRMNQWGILGRYLPAFGRIVGQMQHDLFHVYTVDQHILQVMRNLRRFTMEVHAHEYPLENRLMNGFARPWVLYVAALFHDIAKGRGGDHSVLGMADAKQFCDDHEIDPEDTELIVWLVREHLSMSQIAQKEDISDPQVVHEFASKTGDERRLTALYLLTVADIRGTSPKVWNGWKAQLLANLFQTTANVHRAGKPLEPQGVIAERQRDAMRLIRFFALSDSVQERLWKQLDTVYFLRHSAEEIAWHTRALHYRMVPPEPIVKARLNRIESVHGDADDELPRNLGTHESAGLQVLVYTRDQPDLFLRLVGFFARAGFSIADAKIHTTRHGYALDSFVLLDVQQRDNDRELISFIEYELSQRLHNQSPPDVPGSGRLSREVRHFPIRPQVSIHPDDKGTNFILSVIAADRPGLLFTIGSTLNRFGANLQTAKIATLGERVEDTFLISGQGLEQASHRLALETELTEALRV